MSDKDKKARADRPPPTARQWAEARQKSPDDFEEEETRASSAHKGSDGSKDVTSHSKADAEPGEKRKAGKGLGRA